MAGVIALKNSCGRNLHRLNAVLAFMRLLLDKLLQNASTSVKVSVTVMREGAGRAFRSPCVPKVYGWRPQGWKRHLMGGNAPAAWTIAAQSCPEAPILPLMMRICRGIRADPHSTLLAEYPPRSV